MALLGFYGGTFDPIHQGHLQLALYVAAHCQLKLPATTALPSTAPSAPSWALAALHRAAMVGLAISPLPTITAEHPGAFKNSPSYTVETLEQLRAQYPTDTLLFVIGMDSLNQFQHWHRYQDILQLCHLVVLQRPGYSATEAATASLLQRYQVADMAQLRQQRCGGMLLLQNPLYDISASQIRQTLQQTIRSGTAKN